MGIDRISGRGDEPDEIDQVNEQPDRPEYQPPSGQSAGPEDRSRTDARQEATEANPKSAESASEANVESDRSKDGPKPAQEASRQGEQGGESHDDVRQNDRRESGSTMVAADTVRGQDSEHKPSDANAHVSPLEQKPSYGGFANLAEEFDARARSREVAQQHNNAASDRTAVANKDAEKGADAGLVGKNGTDWLAKPIGEGRPTGHEILSEFDPLRASLPEVSIGEARTYIDENSDEHPWIAPAKDADPVVQRVLVAMDRGQGHALERHEGYSTDERLRRRVSALEDPAQLDADKRSAGIDGCKPGNADHRCGNAATAIQDPAVFATAFARGIEHPDVRDALDAPYEPGMRPDKVAIPIEELLGPEGHRYCSGYRLEPVGGSMDAARDCRSAWVHAQRAGQEPDVPEPKSSPVESFRGSVVEYFFRPNRTRDGYEVATMYVEPPIDETRDS